MHSLSKLAGGLLLAGSFVLSGCASLSGAALGGGFSELSDDEIRLLMSTAKADAAAEEAAAEPEAAPAHNATLFAGIEDKMVSNGAAAITRNSEDITCLRYYANAIQVIHTPQPVNMALGMGKVLFSGAVAGATSGIIDTAGISNNFIRSMASTTANQVAFSASKSGWNALVGGFEQPDPATMVASSAEEVGCPAPTDETLQILSRVPGFGLEAPSVGGSIDNLMGFEKKIDIAREAGVDVVETAGN